MQRTLCQVTCKEAIRHIIKIDVLERGEVIVHQCLPTLIVHNQLTDSLQGVCLPIREVVLSCKHIASYEILKLLLFNSFLCVRIDNTTRADVIEVGQQLCYVCLNLSIRVNLVDGFDGWLFQTYIIIIGGGNDSKLRAGIDHTTSLTRREQCFVFFNTMKSFLCLFIVVVELLIERLTLTETHQLDISNQQFYLVISNL